MKEQHKISFVIPAYNSENTLSEAVSSIFDDNFENGDEVIIVNDASTDNTKQIAEDICRKYGSLVKLINNGQNKGCPASRNAGISIAKNELIFNLDSDNILSTHSIKKLKDSLLKEKADVSSFQEYHYFKSKTKEVTHKWICEGGIMTLSDFFTGLINPGPGGNFLYRKSLWQKIDGYWEYGKGLHEAWGFTLKMLVNGAKFFVVPDTFYFHRYSHESLFVRENSKKGESVDITNKFISPALKLLSPDSLKYVNETPNWFDFLDKKPLYLNGQSFGKNGTLVYTSPIKQLLYLIKTSLFKQNEKIG